MERWQVQSLHDPPLAPLLRFFEEDVPPKASVALAFADNGFGYPYFGPHLDHHVVIVPFGSSAPAWLSRAAGCNRSPRLRAKPDTLGHRGVFEGGSCVSARPAP
jgi:hypothetical protein